MSQKYTIIADPTYGYLRAEPVPTQEEVERYYAEEFYSSEYKKFNDSSLEVQQSEKDFFNSKWLDVYNKCSEYFKNESFTIFDVGCGFSQALLFYREKGINVSGLEPSPEGVAYAQSQGLEVYQAGIEDFDCVEGRRFDVVTLMNVLEHLRNPAETLKKIKDNLLSSRGVLIIDVPNEYNDFQMVANAEFSLNNWWECPPNHINYFSATTLGNLLRKCGYQIVDQEAAFPLEMFMLMGEVYVGNPEIGKICHEKRVKFEALMRKHGKNDKLKAFYRALAELDLGRQIMIYATPVAE
jgi:2-polyprenyl-3-methyl-5-hydroxy-6-metoxy-1,4-benzoquinol methylase